MSWGVSCRRFRLATWKRRMLSSGGHNIVYLCYLLLGFTTMHKCVFPIPFVVFFLHVQKHCRLSPESSGARSMCSVSTAASKNSPRPSSVLRPPLELRSYFMPKYPTSSSGDLMFTTTTNNKNNNNNNNSDSNYTNDNDNNNNDNTPPSSSRLRRGGEARDICRISSQSSTFQEQQIPSSNSNSSIVA